MDSGDVYDDSNEIRLVLIGKTGDGKSSLGNTILGRKEFVAKLQSESVTQESSWKEVKYGSRKIRVVDTPGLFDTGELVLKNKYWLTNEILKSTLLSVPGPHAFLFVLQIGRLTPQDVKTANIIFSLFGEDIYRYIIIVFTHAQKLKDEGMKFEEYTKSLSEFYSNIHKRCGNRVLCFDNTHSSEQEKREFVDELIWVVQKMSRLDFYRNKTIEDATRSFFAEVDEVQTKKHLSYKEAVEFVLQDVQREGTFFKYLKKGSLGLVIGAGVGGAIAAFTPAGLVVAAGVAAATGSVSTATMIIKDKCCVM